MIQDFTQHLGVLSVSIHIPAAQSLKQKRFVLKSLKDRVRRKFNVSIAELDGQDKWQVSHSWFCDDQQRSAPFRQLFTEHPVVFGEFWRLSCLRFQHLLLLIGSANVVLISIKYLEE